MASSPHRCVRLTTFHVGSTLDRRDLSRAMLAFWLTDLPESASVLPHARWAWNTAPSGYASVVQSQASSRGVGIHNYPLASPSQ
jgi:hypothetical protein